MPIIFATALTGILRTSVITKASNSNVNPDPSRVQGTSICFIPWSPQLHLGILQ